MNIKRIIKEELSKILEGDVIRPKFGGHDDDEDGDDGKKSSHHYLDILEKVGNTLKDFIDSMADEMGESEVANLNDLLDKIEDMQSEASEYENDFEVGIHVFKNAGTVTWQFAMLSTPAMQLLHAKHELTCQPILVRVHLKMQVQ